MLNKVLALTFYPFLSTSDLDVTESVIPIQRHGFTETIAEVLLHSLSREKKKRVCYGFLFLDA